MKKKSKSILDLKISNGSDYYEWYRQYAKVDKKYKNLTKKQILKICEKGFALYESKIRNALEKEVRLKFTPNQADKLKALLTEHPAGIMLSIRRNRDFCSVCISHMDNGDLHLIPRSFRENRACYGCKINTPTHMEIFRYGEKLARQMRSSQNLKLAINFLKREGINEN